MRCFVSCFMLRRQCLCYCFGTKNSGKGVGRWQKRCKTRQKTSVGAKPSVLLTQYDIRHKEYWSQKTSSLRSPAWQRNCDRTLSWPSVGRGTEAEAPGKRSTSHQRRAPKVLPASHPHLLPHLRALVMTEGSRNSDNTSRGIIKIHRQRGRQHHVKSAQ